MSKSIAWINAPCLEITQPIGKFYSCVIAAKDVLSISYSDIRRIEERDIERIVGIQREIKPDRVKELKQYVRNMDATFPTSVILSISSKDAKYDPVQKTLKIKDSPEVAKIIDGQHRIAGLSGYEDTFQLVVVVFVDMDLQDQAMTFATINLNQTKVNRSLVYDLYAFQTERSPIKTCHQIARLLNKEKDSPLKGRIKILGAATGEQYEFITQAALVEALVPYISDDPMRDRDALKRGKELPEPPKSQQPKLILRSLFASKKDDVIADVIWTYFDAVASRWNEAWHSAEQGNILNRAQGFNACMRFFKHVYLETGESDGSIEFDSVMEIFKRIKIKDSELSTANYPPGTSGESKLSREMLEQSGIESD
ncbi:MAG: DGQHR domain-containing protein [Gemmatales bacterium]